MYDLRSLRDLLPAIRDQLGSRGADVAWEEVEKLLQDRRDRTAQVEALRHQLKKGSDEVARLKRAKQPAEETVVAMRALRDNIAIQEEHLRAIEGELEEHALRIPNLPHDTVPQGTDASQNVEIRRWGEPPSFGFPPKPHWEIGESLGILDFKRAGKIAGTRFSMTLGAGAQLERALTSLMLDMHLHKHGYTEVLPPYLVNREAMIGTGQLPKFEHDLFHLRDDEYLLIPTAEVPVTNMYRDEILPDTALPIRHVASTPCFRREAGSYGQDTRGLIRLHQFHKVELVAFATPEESYSELERLTNAAEAILQTLELPYRVVSLCRGDLGFATAKTYDLEVWIPSQQAYREISSCSNFETFQARRANIRFRPQGGKPAYLHTLNGSGVAVGRTTVAILENCQQDDGSVIIPTALRRYMNGVERIASNPAP
ncbi:MAG: serine--tRNA ligase [Nitrospira sp.]|nr:serine--tRNA ligase [Nitrospira sp.]MDE0485402.1 serine--tRNA ligase [Nitrospira sp.]